MPRLYRSATDRDHDFNGAVADQARRGRGLGDLAREVRAAEEWRAGEVSTGRRGAARSRPVSVRDVLVHMVEEYARHAGHADLLRECIDGRTGQ